MHIYNMWPVIHVVQIGMSFVTYMGMRDVTHMGLRRVKQMKTSLVKHMRMCSHSHGMSFVTYVGLRRVKQMKKSHVTDSHIMCPFDAHVQYVNNNSCHTCGNESFHTHGIASCQTYTNESCHWFPYEAFLLHMYSMCTMTIAIRMGTSRFTHMGMSLVRGVRMSHVTDSHMMGCFWCTYTICE